METGRVSCWLEKDKCCPHVQNGKEVCLGKHRADKLTFGCGKIMEQVLLEVISGPVKGKAFGCLTNLIAFYDRQFHLSYVIIVVIYLNFNEAFDMALGDVSLSFVGLSSWTIKQSSSIDSGV